ncbi:MAG TPA: hypothetical protein PLE48_08105 [Thiobacillus sp.]|nr:MAG: hypothetical protein A2580_16110 [Hydrogenophilales bacterium RIFOXYD1_FULL_62_11]OYY58318.1 MAG: hypothetical protein B7Y50_13400 [Hydrogenophilales bacterium 28-61-11]OYZ57694.1 MAG: hypothetical protein B7Y21_06425 [Hydrogenophilales bacterium 16-61-112]OZA46755.1 MAG: hypothetical protein B7X81_06390 [Hydrogenophilales bacterium 17-61-76]HQT70374.1 hypothetical protein [Thiobacillus sp.]
MKKTPSDEYLEKARLLDNEASERLLSRTRSKLKRRLEDRTLTLLDVMAIQLEIEDEDLNAWREKVAEIKLADSKKKPKAK